MSERVTIERPQLLNQENYTTSNRTPLILTCRHIFSDKKKTINKHWGYTKIKQILKK